MSPPVSFPSFLENFCVVNGYNLSLFTTIMFSPNEITDSSKHNLPGLLLLFVQTIFSLSLSLTSFYSWAPRVQSVLFCCFSTFAFTSTVNGFSVNVCSSLQYFFSNSSFFHVFSHRLTSSAFKASNHVFMLMTFKFPPVISDFHSLFRISSYL